MTAKWSCRTVEQIEKTLKTDAVLGLKNKTARFLLKKYGENSLYSGENSSPKKYLYKLLENFNLYLLIIAALVAAVFGYGKLSAVIFIIWGCNVFLTLYSYIKAEKTFAEVNGYSLPKAKVIREGKAVITDIKNVVRGDAVLLCEGDIAPCDIRLSESENLAAIEYGANKKQSVHKKNANFVNIFGEDLPAEREENMIFAGAVIVSGKGRGIAVDTGESTYTFETVGELPFRKNDKIVFLENIKKYCNILSIIMLVLIIPISVIGIRMGFFNSFMLGLGLASAAMSELTALVGRIIIACGITNAALIGDKNKNTAIIKNISKIEALADINSLVILDDNAYMNDGKISDDAAETFIKLKEDGVKVAFVLDRENPALYALLREKELDFPIYKGISYAEKAALIKELKKDGNTVAVIGSSVKDVGLMHLADVSFTVNSVTFGKEAIPRVREYQAEKEYGTQITEKEADVSVNRADEKGQGISSVISATDYAKSILNNVNNFYGYLICMQVIRTIAVFASAILGKMILTPVHILFSGLIIDFCAVLIFAFEKTNCSSYNKRDFSPVKFIKNNYFPMILSVISSALIIAIPYISEYLGNAMRNTDICTFSFLSLVIVQFALIFEWVNENPVSKRKSSLNVINLWIALAVVAFFAVNILFGGIREYFDISVYDYKALIWALLPPIIFMLASEIKKSFKPKNGTEE